MRKYRLKKWVLPSVYALSIGVILVSLVFIGKYMATDYEATDLSNYVSDKVVEDDTLEVVTPTNETVDHPYLKENVFR